MQLASIDRRAVKLLQQKGKSVVNKSNLWVTARNGKVVVWGQIGSSISRKTVDIKPKAENEQGQ